MKVIIQAGGKGTRLGKHTKNKPKALVESKGKPILFNTFDMFKNVAGVEFVVIGDYKFNILERYLETFAKDIKYHLVQATKKGTLSGLRKAFKYARDDEQIILTWCDLDLTEDVFKLGNDKNYVAIADSGYSRYSVNKNKIEQVSSDTNGVIGLFSFKDKYQLGKIPKQGEFVKHIMNLSDEGKLDIEPIKLNSIKEFKLSEKRSRYFNELTFIGKKVYKRAIDHTKRDKLISELGWYDAVRYKGFKGIPRDISYDYEKNIMEMNNINGLHPFEVQEEDKKETLERIVRALKKLHKLDVAKNTFELGREADMYKTYVYKTFKRLSEVSHLLPKDSVLTINGKECRNPLYMEKKIRNYFFNNLIELPEFTIIHGDPTFSNMMIKKGTSKEVILFDPRAKFGDETLYGDPRYDWAKLYYSIKGNYDNFNKKKFDLSFEVDNVYINVESQGYEFLENDFFAMIPDIDRNVIKYLHALIWLSLTSYYWEDYDCIMGAFYLGAYYLEEVIK